jgi:hypothetical protein
MPDNLWYMLSPASLLSSCLAVLLSAHSGLNDTIVFYLTKQFLINYGNLCRDRGD